jgi:small Trp-rich protein
VRFFAKSVVLGLFCCVLGQKKRFFSVAEGAIMYFLGLGVVLLLMKYLEFGAVAQWSWWVVLAPFGLATAWWAWADWSGYTKRRAMEKMDKRKADRIAKARDNLGLNNRRK